VMAVGEWASSSSQRAVWAIELIAFCVRNVSVGLAARSNRC
jgi:hypothetical protein